MSDQRLHYFAQVHEVSIQTRGKFFVVRTHDFKSYFAL